MCARGTHRPRHSRHFSRHCSTSGTTFFKVFCNICLLPCATVVKLPSEFVVVITDSDILPTYIVREYTAVIRARGGYHGCRHFAHPYVTHKSVHMFDIRLVVVILPTHMLHTGLCTCLTSRSWLSFCPSICYTQVCVHV